MRWKLFTVVLAALMLGTPAAASADWHAVVVEVEGDEVLVVFVDGSVQVSVGGTGAQPYISVSGSGSAVVGDGCTKNTDTATCTGDFAYVYIEGDEGDDSISANLASDSAGALYGEIHGGGGNDVISGSTSSSTTPVLDIYGEAGDDTLRGSRGGDTLDGGDGNDTLDGLSGDDTVSGGPGDDTVVGSVGADILTGGPGDDTTADDYYRGGKNLNVTLDGVPNDGEPGERDNLQPDIEKFNFSATTLNFVGSDNAEQVVADLGAAGTIDGRGGADRLIGKSGNETLLGGAGDDYLEGGFGHDVLDGGPGVDQFVGDTATRDTIAIGNDTIRARDGNAENIDCGIGADSAQVDANDIVASTCESIELPPPPIASPPPPPAPVNSFVVPKTPSIAALVKSGLAIRQTCVAACKITAELLVDKKTAKQLGLGKDARIGTAKGALKKAGQVKLTIKLSARLKRKVKRLKRLTITVRVRAGATTSTRTLNLKP